MKRFNGEFANTAIQATGTLLSVLGLAALIHLAMLQGGTLRVASVSVYGGTLVLAFLSSTLYHGTRHAKAKSILRTVDHCAIYLLIAGTYTPIALLVLRHDLGWVLLTAVWGVALTAAVLRILWSRHLLRLRIVLYLALGWPIVAWAKPVVEGLGLAGTGFLVAGGLAYTLGIPFYRWKTLRYNEAIWHLFVILGSACHFVAIAFYALPAPVR